MAINNPDILARLQKARTKKKTEAQKPLARNEPLKRSKPLERGGTSKPKGRSEKMKGVMAALGPLYQDFIEKKPVCEINSPECTQTAETVHHTAGRGVKQIMNIKTWKSCCSNCNLYVEKHHKWAREHGFKVSRHKKED